MTILIQNWYKNRIQSKLFEDQKNPPDLLKGAVKFGTFKFIDLKKKKKTLKSQCFPVVYFCGRNRVVVIWCENLHFYGEEL